MFLSLYLKNKGDFVPEFLEKKLKAKYGEDSDVPYKIMNKLKFMKGNKETPKGAAVQKKHEKKEEIKKEEEKKIEDLSEEQLNFAKTLYKALNNPDPSIQRQTLKVLASAAGLDLKEIETKKEGKQAEETLLELLKAGLGEYDF